MVTDRSGESVEVGFGLDVGVDVGQYFVLRCVRTNDAVSLSKTQPVVEPKYEEMRPGGDEKTQSVSENLEPPID
jgi:hypothetical protein